MKDSPIHRLVDRARNIFAGFALVLVFGLPVRSIASDTPDYTRMVDVFIGTGGHGHTFPGATMPFGMLQLSPDTRNDGSWDSCAGYHLSDTNILGFSHTHLSGTGVPDYGDILLLPITGDVKLSPGDPKIPRSGYRSSFRHSTERAEPGYYSVVLDDYQVKAELTATDRVGFHRYTFRRAGTANILLDLIHRDPVTESSIRLISDRRIEGFRRAKYWAGDQYHYFAMEFSRPFTGHKIFEHGTEITGAMSEDGKALQALAEFSVARGEVIEVKVATSAVNTQGAWKNLEAEGQDKTFDEVGAAAKAAWNVYLGKIQIEGGTARERRTFYSALYHCLLTPNLFQDVDGQYRGMDGNVHSAVGFTNYTVFSLWDTFRGLHPLLTILDPARDADFAKTLVNMSQLYGELPMWELAANDTRCMIGYHAVPVIVDAYAKGITNFDLAAAFTEMKRTAMLDKRGLKDYRTLGFVPANKGSQSVSKTLEYAYDDWCIAQAAKWLGRQEDHEYFLARSQFYRNAFDPSVGYMRGMDDAHNWSEPFDPQAPGFNYTEGNAYQYTVFVPHDVPGLIELLGGKEALAKYLDKVFETPMTLKLSEENDISGLIGQYAHGNEPSHHIAYLYCYAGQPWKAQAMVRKILKEQYDATPGGLNGNEDCGQMSAWYVLSALGFYSVCPGQTGYVIGGPLFKRATLKLDNGKSFTIKAGNNGPGKPYIQSAGLNGQPSTACILDHSTILAGGELAFQMGPKVNESWGLEGGAEPAAPLHISAVPFLAKSSDQFLDAFKAEVRCSDPRAEIFYTLDGSVPTRDSTKYATPFEITTSTTIKMRTYTPGAEPGIVVTRQLVKSTGATAAAPQPGLNYNYYEGVYRSVYDFAKDPPAASGTADRPTADPHKREDWFAIAYEGLINIPCDGDYTFYVLAKDGLQLKIDGDEQFESDGRKDDPLPQQSTIALRAGLHKFELKYFKCTDKITFDVDWSGPGIAREPVPKESFFHSTSSP